MSKEEAAVPAPVRVQTRKKKRKKKPKELHNFKMASAFNFKYIHEIETCAFLFGLFH